MGINIRIYDAAHQYGLDNMNANDAIKAINNIILGTKIDVTNSWTGDLLPGQSGEETTNYTGGFTIKRVIKNIDGATGEVSLISVFRTDTNELLKETVGNIQFPIINTGITLQNENILSMDDNITGNEFNNIIRGYAGNDLIDGAAGIDTAYFSGFNEDYTFSINSLGSIVINGIDGTDTLRNIERIQFEDKEIAFDLNGNAGIAVKIIGAVFGKSTINSPTDVGILLSLIDGGLNYSDVMQFALNQKLGVDFSNTDVINLLYENLLGGQPSASDLAHWNGTITSGEFTQTSLAVMAAETGINKQNINLTFLAKTGLEFSNSDASIALTGQNHIDSLLGNNKWGEGINTGASVNYSFRTDASTYSTDPVTGYGSTEGSGEPWQTGWSPVTSVLQQGINASLDAWAEFANIRFTEVTDSATVTGDIRFSVLTDIADSITYQPEPSTRGGDVWFADSNELNAPTKGTLGYMMLLREAGHAIGLEHPNEGQVTANASIDAIQFSIMSKRDFLGDTLDNNRDILYPTTPMLSDIAAIQYIYGENSNTRRDDTIYSWGVDQVIYETIWDGGGNDTIDWSNQITPVSIDLNAGAWSFLGPERWDGQISTNQNLAIAFNTIIENVIGGAANDLLIGNGANNFLDGGGGDDEMHGGSGDDFFDFSGNFRAGNDTMYGGQGDDSYVISSLLDVVIELPNAGIDVIWSEQAYSIEEIENVENLYLFGFGSIDATGNALANELQGNAGDNSLSGGDGNDILIGNEGNDSLDGGADVDTAIYLTNKDDNIIDTSEAQWRIESGDGTVDILTNIERLKFLDASIAFDLDGNAGDVAKIIGAVFGASSLDRKDFVSIGLNLLDNGMEYPDLMELALNAKLGSGYSNDAEVVLLFENLLGIQPLNSELDFWTNTITSGQFTQTSLAIMAADTDFNINNIDLVGLVQNGIEFL